MTLPAASPGSPGSHPALEAGPDAGRFDSRVSFEAAFVAALDEAAQANANRLLLSDSDFTAWPLGRPDVVAAFGRWVRSQGRLTLLAADFSGLAVRAPRWMAWRRQWSHVVQCLAVHEELAGSVPTLLFMPRRLALQLHDREHWRGSVTRQPLELAHCADLIDALSQRADESLPVTTLGL